MANFTFAGLMFLLAFISGTRMMVEVNGGVSCDYLSTSPGGCPDQAACRQACVGCYRGVGEIVPQCVAPTTPLFMWECLCFFRNGAPCPPPPGGPRCPGS